MALFHILLAPLPFSRLTAFFNLNLFVCVKVFWWVFFSVCVLGNFFFPPKPLNSHFAVFSNHLSGPSGVVMLGGAS